MIYHPLVKATYEKVRRLPGIGKFVERTAQKFSLGYVEQVRKQLDKISSSMCAAKWLQSTVHLEIGETHSCHHPKRHAVPLDELARTPNALHTTEHKKRERKKMLKGERPAECAYCWNTEDLPGKPLSDRHYKSAEDWARPYLKDLSKMTGDEDISPTYLELSFSSNCQLKCSYCYPSVSSSIRGEIKKHGPYPTSDKFGELESVHEGTAHTEAFWKWWPEVRKNLKVFRLTGGEPLLEEGTFKVMESFLEEPLKDLKFSINSNLMVSDERFNRFRALNKKLIEARALREFQVYASIDTWGEQAEWIRHGLEVKKFCRNLESILSETPEVSVTLMVTFNALSPFRFKELMDYVIWCRQTYPKATLKMGVSTLHHPSFMALDVLPQTLSPIFEDILQHHYANNMKARGNAGFSAAEIARFERIISWWKERPTATGRWNDLRSFVTEYDQRKGTCFNDAFPGFWEQLDEN